MTSCAKMGGRPGSNTSGAEGTSCPHRGSHSHIHWLQGIMKLGCWGCLQGSSGTHQVVPGVAALRQCPNPVDATRLSSHPERCRCSAHGNHTSMHRRARMRSRAALGTPVAHAQGSVQLQRHRRLPNGCQHPPNARLKYAATHGNVCWAHRRGPDRFYLYVTAGRCTGGVPGTTAVASDHRQLQGVVQF